MVREKAPWAQKTLCRPSPNTIVGTGARARAVGATLEGTLRRGDTAAQRCVPLSRVDLRQFCPDSRHAHFQGRGALMHHKWTGRGNTTGGLIKVMGIENTAKKDLKMILDYKKK